MKIAFLIKSLSCGGAERAAVSLADSFAENGNDVSIITVDGADCFYPLSDKVRHINCALSEIKLSGLKRFSGAISRAAKLRKTVKQEKPDVLIAMSFSMVWYAVLTTVFTPVKAVGTERSNPYKYKASKINSFLRRFFYRFTDGYVFQTKKSAKFFSKQMRKCDIIIPNAIGNDFIYQAQPPTEREKVIISVGRLDIAKRFDLLIEAFDKIADQIPDYRLVIYGDGDERDALEQKIKVLPSRDRISLPGADPDAVKYVNRAKVFALTSDYEGMPNALIEAMAMGVPCVSTRCDMGPEELITDGENGLLVDVGSTDRIAEAIMKIIESPQLAEKLSANAVKLREAHSMKKIVRTWIDFLENLKH